MTEILMPKQFDGSIPKNTLEKIKADLNNLIVTFFTTFLKYDAGRETDEQAIHRPRP
jgi:hypothetical protein